MFVPWSTIERGGVAEWLKAAVLKFGFRPPVLDNKLTFPISHCT
jgi:hypothetical protein